MKRIESAIAKTTEILDRIHGKGFGWTTTAMLVMLVGSFFIPN